MTKSGVCLGGLGMMSVWLLTGCANFFVDPITPTDPTDSGDYAYVVNTNNTLSEFVVGTGTLTAVSGSPLALPVGLGAASAAVTRANTYVYVGGNGAIECYSIGSGGALAKVAAGGATEAANFVSLETSPDGQWLFALDALTPAAPILYVFSITAATGALVPAGSSAIQLPVPGPSTAVARMVKISPNGEFVAVVLGGGGDLFYNFATSTGVLTQAGSLRTNGFDDDSILFDSTSGFAYIGRYGRQANASTIVSYTVSTAGVLTQLGTAASGDTPYSLVLDATNTYLYSANRGSGSVSGFSSAAGVLTALGSSPYVAGTAVSAMARDQSGTYLLATSVGGSPDLNLYQLDSTTAGKLDAVATSLNGSGVAGSVAVAMTHSSTIDF